MFRAFEREKSKSFNFKRMFEITGWQVHSHFVESGKDGLDEKAQLRNSFVHKISADRDHQQIVRALANNSPRVGIPQSKAQSDIDMMKERFAKLLLGEDMSGGGKGVSSALALSNAITNLAASIFGEQSKLEPMPAERKARWRKEIEWLLSVTDHIVEFVPSYQTSKDGTSMEIMVTRQRIDLLMNIPALRKLDAMLIGYLDDFRDHKEFWYVSKEEDDVENGNSERTNEKWWLPAVKVLPNGLSDVSKNSLLFQKDSVNQVLKAAMAINSQVLSEMEIPDDYIESLPKNGRSSLGDCIYKSITIEYFDPEQFLSTVDLSTEHKVIDLKNKIEASIVIWKRKMHHKEGKTHWGSAISLEKREQFEDRAEIVLQMLKHRFPGLPQSALDVSKIQYNQDVGYAILEGYSRILESLAFTIMSRIEDVIYADSIAQNPSLAESKGDFSLWAAEIKSPKAMEEETQNLTPPQTPNSLTLSHVMGWDNEWERKTKKSNNTSPKGNAEELSKGENEKIMTKLAHIVINKRMSYIERLENLGSIRSPVARH